MLTARLSLISLASALAVICWTASGSAQEKPLPPLKAPPPNPRHAIVPKPPPPGPTPSLRQVLEALRRLPEGAKQLERARRSGVNIPEVGSSADNAFRTSATGSGPGMAEISFNKMAEPMPPPPLFAKVTRRAQATTVAGLGNLSVEVDYPAFATYAKVWGPLDRIFWAGCPAGGSCDLKSWIFIGIDAQTTGWYLVNVQATPIAAEMRVFSGSAGYTLLTTFPLPTPNAAGYGSYPVLVNLMAGSHSLVWVNRDFFPYASEVDVWKF